MVLLLRDINYVDRHFPAESFTIQRVHLLVKMGYLRYHNEDEEKITLPSPSALRWLHAMLLPPPERPLFTVDEVAKITNSSSEFIRKLCATYAIPIHADESWGELISPDSFIRLLDSLFGYRTPMRFDRAALVEWMRGMRRDRQLRYNLAYSQLINTEITRIVRLPEPERTMRAVAFWEAYRDAKMISNCMGEYYATVKAEMGRVEKRVNRMMREVTSTNLQVPPFPQRTEIETEIETAAQAQANPLATEPHQTPSNEGEGD
jgi:hypothetical protein